MDWLWLLPVLFPAVGFFWCCCGGCSFSDDFESAKPGYTVTQTTSPATTYSVSGGHLLADGPGVSSYTQECPLPATAGGTITVEAEVYNDPTYNGGVGYGNSAASVGTAVTHRVFWGPRWQWGDSAFTRVTSAGTVTEFIPQAGNDGDVYRIEMSRASGTTWSVEVFINGVSKRLAVGNFNFPDPVAIGVSASNGAEWDNLALTAG